LRRVLWNYLRHLCADCKLLMVQLVARLTKDIVETYQTCNPQFKYSEELNPKRYLTSPSAGVLNDGHDNVNSDLILTVNFALINLDTHRRFVYVCCFYSSAFIFLELIFLFCTWFWTVKAMHYVLSELVFDIFVKINSFYCISTELGSWLNKF
jgi:hypothetical protein